MKARLPASLQAYLVAIAAVTFALVLAVAFRAFFERIPLLPFLIAVFASAWFGGLRPGVLAIILSIPLIDYFMLEPYNTPGLDTGSMLLLVVFVLTAALITFAYEQQVRLGSALQAQREHYRVTLRAIGDAVIATDTGGQITFMNPAAEKLTGWASAEAEGRRLTDVFHIADTNTTGRTDEVRTRSSQLNALAGDATLIARSGADYLIESRAAPIYDSGGKPIGAVHVFRDVSQRRQEDADRRLLAEANAALTSSLDYETTLQRVTELAVPAFADLCIVHMVEPDGTFRHVAATPRIEIMQRLNDGYSLNADAPHSFPRVIRTGETELIPELSPALPDTLERDQTHWQLLQALGIRSTLCVPITGPQGILGAMTFATLETGHAYTHADTALAEELARRVGMAVQNARLYAIETQARREAEHANALKLKFLAMISHELRTPLTSIKGFASTLLTDDVVYDDSDQRRYLQIINEESDKLAELIDQLLDISRLQAGSLGIRPREITVDSIFETAAAQLDTLARNHVLRISQDAHLPPIVADKHRIAQVITNLISNAVKYTPAHSEIRVRVTRQHDHLVFRVSDDGMGIPEEAQSYIFEPFRRVEERGLSKGAGLGLAICKGVVEAHGGEIRIEESGSHGTTIMFTLPLHEPHR